MDLEIIILSEVSHAEKDSIIYVESKKNHDANELICKTEIDSQT